MNDAMMSRFQDLISRGKFESVLKELSQLPLNTTYSATVVGLLHRLHQLKMTNMLGTIHQADYALEQNKIVNNLLELLQLISDSNMSTTQPNQPTSPDNSQSSSKTTFWEFIRRTEVIISIIAGLVTIGAFKYCQQEDNMQLTVYVHGKNQQDTILQNGGNLVVDFGHDRRYPTIGQAGRTNFGEIPQNFKGQEIGIGLQATGYELVSPQRKYKLDGKPVYLAVRKDTRLGTIRGSVNNFNGSQAIQAATIQIDLDTVIKTDSLGIFKVQLPDRLHKDKYKLKISKSGFKTKEEFYYPNSSDLEIHLEK